MRWSAEFQNRFRRWTYLLPVLAACGCESPGWVRSLNDAFSTHPPRATHQEEEQHRREYSATHSRQSMNWLLANCVSPGMSFKEVSSAMGEEGTPEPSDRWIKTRGTIYQVSDSTYCFGPDSEGQSVYLVFRDDQLIGFDPEEFRRKLPKAKR